MIISLRNQNNQLGTPPTARSRRRETLERKLSGGRTVSPTQFSGIWFSERNNEILNNENTTDLTNMDQELRYLLKNIIYFLIVELLEAKFVCYLTVTIFN